MSKNILFINASWEQEALVKSIYDRGHNIIALSKNLPSYRKYLKKHISCDEYEISSIINSSLASIEIKANSSIKI